jgi:hypothetical protein
LASEKPIVNGELSDSGLVASVYTDHDGDPDSDSSTTSAIDNNTDTEYGVDFATPTAAPTVGAGLQEFRAGVGLFGGGQATPTARIELWENGSLVRAGSDANVTGFQVLSFTWNANELGTSDGSLVQCKVIGTKSGGKGSARNATNIGQIEWNADVSSSTNYTLDATTTQTYSIASPVEVDLEYGRQLDATTNQTYSAASPIEANLEYGRIFDITENKTYSIAAGSEVGLNKGRQLNATETQTYSVATSSANFNLSFKPLSTSYSAASPVEANLEYGRLVDATENQTYSVSTPEANLEHGRIVDATETQTYSVSAIETNLEHGRIFDATENKTYSIAAGEEVGLNKGRLVDATETQTYNVASTEVNLKHGRRIDATENQTYIHSGSDATLIPPAGAYVLDASTNQVYTASGIEISLEYGRKIDATELQTYSEVGTNALLIHGWETQTNGGSISISEADTGLIYTPIGGGGETITTIAGRFYLDSDDVRLLGHNEHTQNETTPALIGAGKSFVLINGSEEGYILDFSSGAEYNIHAEVEAKDIVDGHYDTFKDSLKETPTKEVLPLHKKKCCHYIKGRT